jgi:hypothetical protein
MKTQPQHNNEMRLLPVDHAMLVEISGGVGPVFDLSKVEGFKLPSWCLPLSPRMSSLTIR